MCSFTNLYMLYVEYRFQNNLRWWVKWPGEIKWIYPYLFFSTMSQGDMGQILEVGCMELFFQFVLATNFFYAFYDTGNSKKRIIKKYEKFRWCTQFSFGDFKIRHFSQIVIILVCKEHKFLIYLSQYMLLYVLYESNSKGIFVKHVWKFQTL